MPLLLTAVYAAIVIYVSVHHEPWRDEVVPMTLVRQAGSLRELWQTLRYEGHPILWYLCLRYVYLALGSTVALKVTSVLVAIAAVGIFLVYAPLPLSLKTLFTFSWLPLYEYSVLARDYGLGMLMLFAFCALYPRRRDHPVATALALAGLANSNSLGFILAVAAGTMLVIDAVIDRPVLDAGRRGWQLAAIAVYVAGLAFSAWTDVPEKETLILPVYDHTFGTVVGAFVAAVVAPARQSWFLLGLVPWLWFWMYFLTLARWPGLLCFAALSVIGFSLVSDLVIPPSPSRLGYNLLVVMATMWLEASRSERAPPPRAGRLGSGLPRVRRFLRFPLAVTLAGHVLAAVHLGISDVQHEYSSSRRLGALIASDPRLHDAIVIGEPETAATSLSYYQDNPIFLIREGTFARSSRFFRGHRQNLSLSELIGTAHDLRTRYGHPVLIVFGWNPNGPEEQRVFAGTVFELRFTSTPADRDDFRRQTERLASLRDASRPDESYDVFVLW